MCGIGVCGADLSQEPPGHFHILKCAASHSFSPELQCVRAGEGAHVTIAALMPCSAVPLRSFHAPYKARLLSVL